jgi:hypothetical protein
MSSEADYLVELADRLTQYADLPEHQNIRLDLLSAADAIKEHAAVLAAYEAGRKEREENEAAKKS